MRAHLQETIGNAKLSGSETLEQFIARATSLEPAEVGEMAGRTMAIIEGIPDLLESVADAALRRGVGLLVQPLLDHAADYFRDPADHAPESAYGLAGLLDDAYLALSLVHLVQENYEPLVQTDVAGQLGVLRRLLEPDLIEELDAEVGRAVLKLARSVSSLRERSRLDVEFYIQRR
jgi:hypothetical protein